MIFQTEIIFQLFLAVILGFIIGIERVSAGKEAGVRTYSLVSLSSCIFTIISYSAFPDLVAKGIVDPTRIASQIVVGIGFLGAGLIIFNENKIIGLTSAAGLWAAAAIGMAVGFGLYSLAISAAFFVLVILYLIRISNIEQYFRKISLNREKENLKDQFK